MSKTENNFVEVYVINENTGHIVRHAIVNTSERLLEKVNRYATKDSIVIASMDRFVYCFYIKRESYIITTTKKGASSELINFFKDVLAGLYDNDRDAFYMEKGRVMTLFQFIGDIDGSIVDVLFKCLGDIWTTRYYSRFLRK